MNNTFLALVICLILIGQESAASELEWSTKANQIFNQLVGEWRFELGKVSGHRSIKKHYETGVLAWSERFNEKDIMGHGYLGYDEQEQHFYSLVVHNVPGEHGYSHGTLSGDGTEITYTSAKASADPMTFKSIFKLHDSNHFSHTAMTKQPDGEWTTNWVADFYRVP